MENKNYVIICKFSEGTVKIHENVIGIFDTLEKAQNAIKKLKEQNEAIWSARGSSTKSYLFEMSSVVRCFDVRHFSYVEISFDIKEISNPSSEIFNEEDFEKEINEMKRINNEIDMDMYNENNPEEGTTKCMGKI